MWWASAGEQRLHSDEEAEFDASLFSALSLSPTIHITPRLRSQSSVSAKDVEDGTAKQEMAIIAYFHRLTTQILTTLSDLVDATDSDDESEDQAPLQNHDGAKEEENGPQIYVSSSDLERMGLDVWSSSDHTFVEEVTKAYFGRRATVEGGNVDVCGIRIC